MARRAGKNSTFAFDGATIGGVESMTFTYEGAVVEGTGMDSAGRRTWERGRVSASFEANGHWETGATEYPVAADIEAAAVKALKMNFGSTGGPLVSSASAFLTGIDYVDSLEGTMDWTMRGVISGTAPTIGVSS